MSQLYYRQLLERIELFRNLSVEDVERIFTKGMTMHVPKGSVIFYQNTTGNTMFVILAGKVDLYSKDQRIATLGTGDTMGEMALISEEPRSATAIASEDTNLFVLSETTFQRLMTKRVAVQMLLNIIGTLSKRLRDTNKKLSEAKRRDG